VKKRLERRFLVSDKMPLPPGVAVAARRILQDENDEPQHGDRVPYVIVRSGNPHTRLVERAIAPEGFLANRRVLLHLKGSDSSGSVGAHLQSRRCGRSRVIRRDAENNHCRRTGSACTLA